MRHLIILVLSVLVMVAAGCRVDGDGEEVGWHEECPVFEIVYDGDMEYGYEVEDCTAPGGDLVCCRLAWECGNLDECIAPELVPDYLDDW